MPASLPTAFSSQGFQKVVQKPRCQPLFHSPNRNTITAPAPSAFSYMYYNFHSTCSRGSVRTARTQCKAKEVAMSQSKKIPKVAANCGDEDTGCYVEPVNHLAQEDGSKYGSNVGGHDCECVTQIG